MKRRLIACLSLLCIASAHAAVPLPPELTGVWATQGAQFHGQSLWTGAAIYLDADGQGAVVGGQGDGAKAAIIGVRLAVTAYDPAGHVLGIELSDGHRHVDSQLSYDPASHSLVSALDRAHYQRRFDRLDDSTRKALSATH